MNKKAQFTSFLVVFLIIVLSSLAYTMYKYNKYEEKLKLNKESAITFEIYNHVEKNKYYLEKAAEISKQKALLELKNNGGHLQGCTKDLTSGKIIWNSCPKLDLNGDFKIIFEKEFKKYIKTQNQPYFPIGYEYTTSNFDTELEKIKNLEPTIILTNDNLNIKFNYIFYNMDYKVQSKENNSFSIRYTFNPFFSIKAPDFSMYTKICDILTSCNLGPQISSDQIDDCFNELEKINNLKITKNNQIFDLSGPNLDFSIKLNSIIRCQQGLIT